MRAFRSGASCVYTGIFTPTEGAAVGAVSTGLLAWLRGGFTGANLREAFELTASGTGMVFMIVLGPCQAVGNDQCGAHEESQARSVWMRSVCKNGAPSTSGDWSTIVEFVLHKQ